LSELSAQEAADMSRAEALRVLATAEDVPEQDRRVAELMLAGPEISFTEEQALRRFPSKRPVLDVSVKRALLEYGVAIGREREAAQADIDELMGL
jgi:hypothetical protein